MSVDIPAGPELDRAVALALGWEERNHFFGSDDKVWIDPHSMVHTSCPEFSTAPRLQDELLAALDANGWHWEIRKHDLGVEAVCYHIERELPFVAHGPTISVALCRLLLAVKGAS